MKVKRIVANLATPDVDKARAFYEKMSVMSEGGSGTPVPDLSIEVDNVEEALSRVRKAGIATSNGATQG